MKFRGKANLLAHKNRKTPCFIREVPDDQKDNPCRCIWCNKILANRDSLAQHRGRCKMKNGGMDLLAPDVRIGQELRILKEQNAGLRVRLDQAELCQREMLAVIAGMRADLLRVAKPAVVINDYRMPNISWFWSPAGRKFFMITLKNKLRCTPIYLIQKVWFNMGIPENRSIIMKAAKGDVQVMCNGWETKSAEEVGEDIRICLYAIVMELYKISGVESEADLIALMLADMESPVWRVSMRVGIIRELYEGSASVAD